MMISSLTVGGQVAAGGREPSSASGIPGGGGERIQAAKDTSLQISATHLQSALELVPGVMEIARNSPQP
jgi:hypothetical protein